MPPSRALQPVLRGKKHFPRHQRNSFFVSSITNSTSATASANASSSPVPSRKRNYSTFQADFPQREICGGCKLPINHQPKQEEVPSSQKSYICDCEDVKDERMAERRNSWVDGEVLREYKEGGGGEMEEIRRVPPLNREDAVLAMPKEDEGVIGHSVM